MPNQEKINNILKNHEERISALEAILTKPETKSIKKIEKSLSDHIIALRDNGFFTTPKSADETHKKLQGTYHCEPDRIAMALLRLANRKLLRKATKSTADKKYKAYVW